MQKKIIKFITRGSLKDSTMPLYAVMTPGQKNIWENCKFVYNPFIEKYDWLVVFDEIAHSLPNKTEILKCPKENTILVTSEPSSIARYGKHFAKQFHYVITNHEEKYLPHPNALRSQTGIYWLYGKDFDTIVSEKEIKKTKLISTICSSKREGNALYKKRFDFTKKLEEEIKKLERFGRGIRPVEKKYQAIDPYKFHVVIENHSGEHMWSEKLADAFLGYCVPIYYGCTNIYDYFPKDSIILIDIDDFEGSIKKIKNIISTPGEYERRLEAVKKAREKVIYEYHLFAMIEKIVNSQKEYPFTPGVKIVSRRVLRSRHLDDLLSYFAFRIKNFFIKMRDKIV